MSLLFPLATGLAAALITIFYMEICDSIFKLTFSVRTIIETWIRSILPIHGSMAVTCIAFIAQCLLSIFVSYCFFILVFYQLLKPNTLETLTFGIVTGLVGVLIYVFSMRRLHAGVIVKYKVPLVLLSAHVIQAFILFFIYHLQ